MRHPIFTVTLFFLALLPMRVWAQTKDTIDITSKGFPFSISFTHLKLHLKTTYRQSPNDTYAFHDDYLDISDNEDASKSEILAKSFLIRDTVVLTYRTYDGPDITRGYGTFYYHTIKFVVNFANDTLLYFYYGYHSEDHPVHGIASSDLGITIKGLPVTRTVRGGLTSSINGDKVTSLLTGLTYSSYSYGIEVPPPTQVETALLSWDFPSQFTLSMENLASLDNIRSVTKREITFFPNPASNIIQINFPTPLFDQNELQIFDMLGRNLKSINIPASTQNIELSTSDLPEGSYVVKLCNDTYKIFVSK